MQWWLPPVMNKNENAIMTPAHRWFMNIFKLSKKPGSKSVSSASKFAFLLLDLGLDKGGQAPYRLPRK